MDPRYGGSTAGFSTATGTAAEVASAEPIPLPALTILCHPDLGRIGDLLLLGELASGREAGLSRHQPRFTAPGAAGGTPLDDPFLSRRPLILSPLPGGSVRLDRGGSRTRLEVGGVAVENRRDVGSEALDEGVVVELAGRVVLLLHRRTAPAPAAARFGLVGDSSGMERVRAAIERVADLEVPVLLRGETGTGKELIACALHDRGTRRGERFVGVNLGALPPSLAAAELFGARKGAYTGASRNRSGYFGRADGGTLFLDEIGDAPAEIQVMLLRALETGEITAVGSQTPRRIDVRVISATDADLERLVASSGFRAQLMHRLAGYTIRLPALRRRRDDLGRLLVHFLELERASAGEPPPPNDPAARRPWLDATLVSRLARYHWPGNVRQLRNVVRQLVIDGRGQPFLGAGARLDELLPASPVSEPTGPVAADRVAADRVAADRVDADPAETERPPDAEPPAPRRKPSKVTEEELVAALRAERWNLKAAAAALRISRTSLYALLERSPNVRAAADVPAAEIRRAWERHGGDLEAMVDELEISERALRQRLKDLGLR